VTIRRVRHRAECERLLGITEPLEPRTQAIDARLLLGPSRSRRIYVAEQGEEVIGMAVVYRRHLDRWGAYTLLLHDVAAKALARVVDRSPARDVAGVAGDVSPLHPFVRRARKRVDQVFNHFLPDLPFRPEFAEPDPRTRLATPADVRGLAKLYAEYPFIDAPTMVQLRRMFRRSFDQGLPIVVLEADGEILAAERMESRGCRYARWTDLVVHPEHRRRGYFAAMAPLVGSVVIESGLGLVGEQAPSFQPHGVVDKVMQPAFEFNASERFVVLHLRTPRRFPGQGRLRLALYSLGGRRMRRSSA
jgi:hypothetical protein